MAPLMIRREVAATLPTFRNEVPIPETDVDNVVDAFGREKGDDG